MDGMVKAYEIINKHGLEELEKEIAFRNVNFVPLEITQEQLMIANADLRERLEESMLATMCVVLIEEFGMDKTKLKQFVEQWNYQVSCLDNFETGVAQVTTAEYAEWLNDEYGMEFNVELLRKIENEYAELRKKYAI